jgi:peptidoglycan pentaglycine glycine transferase (the first glycine)
VITVTVPEVLVAAPPAGRRREIAPLEARHRDAWDALVANQPAAGFMQSWAWSTFKELEGYRAIRLGLFEGRDLCGGAIGYAFPSPAEGGLVVVPDGPVLDWNGPGASRSFRAIVEAMAAHPAADRAVAVRVAPRLPSDSPALAGLPRAPVDLVPDETLLVELGPEAAMLGRMRPKGRYNVRLALRRGVEVETVADPGRVHDLYAVLAETARYQDFALEPRPFFVNLGRALVPAAGGRLHFARYRGVTLAAALTLRHGETVTFLYGGHLPLFPEVMASYALHFEVMRAGAREGARLYDLYGYVAPGDPGHPYDRFSRFKEKLGGVAHRRVGARDVLLYDRLAEAILAVAGSTARGAERPDRANGRLR